MDKIHGRAGVDGAPAIVYNEKEGRGMQGLQRQRWLNILLGALPMLAMMIVIFIFSGSMGGESSEQSNAVGEWVLGILGIEIPPGQTASDVPILWGLTIRKFAHIFLYFCLGASAFLFMAMLQMGNHRLQRPAWCGGGALLISFAYACLDEWHQSFVAGRSGKMADVGIDAIGFITAAVICAGIWYLTLLISGKRSERRHRENLPR